MRPHFPTVTKEPLGGQIWISKFKNGRMCLQCTETILKTTCILHKQVQETAHYPKHSQKHPHQQKSSPTHALDPKPAQPIFVTTPTKIFANTCTWSKPALLITSGTGLGRFLFFFDDTSTQAQGSLQNSKHRQKHKNAYIRHFLLFWPSLKICRNAKKQ